MPTPKSVVLSRGRSPLADLLRCSEKMCCCHEGPKILQYAEGVGSLSRSLTRHQKHTHTATHAHEKTDLNGMGINFLLVADVHLHMFFQPRLYWWTLEESYL